MSRPTEEKKDRTIKIRISEDLYDRIKSDNMSEKIRNALESSFVPTKKDNVPQKDTITRNLKDIESMVVCAGGDLDSFLDDLDFKLTMEIICLKDGLIDVDRYEGDKEVEKELADLRMACEEKGVSLAEAVKKAKQGVWGMRQ